MEVSVFNNEKFLNILNESIELFKKYGIRSISMDDIAREMCISKKTLYSFVSGKTDLIEKILLYSVYTFEEWFNLIEVKNLNAIDELLEISVRMNQEYQKFDTSHVFELKKYYPSIFKNTLSTKLSLHTESLYRILPKESIRGITVLNWMLSLLPVCMFKK